MLQPTSAAAVEASTYRVTVAGDTFPGATTLGSSSTGFVGASLLPFSPPNMRVKGLREAVFDVVVSEVAIVGATLANSNSLNFLTQPV